MGVQSDKYTSLSSRTSYLSEEREKNHQLPKASVTSYSSVFLVTGIAGGIK